MKSGDSRFFLFIHHQNFWSGRVDQLVRSFACHAKGCEFEPRHVRHKNKKFMNTQEQARLQQKLEEILDSLCKITGRDIFVILPENREERIPYLKKEIVKTLDLIK